MIGEGNSEMPRTREVLQMKAGGVYITRSGKEVAIIESGTENNPDGKNRFYWRGTFRDGGTNEWTSEGRDLEGNSYSDLIAEKME